MGSQLLAGMVGRAAPWLTVGSCLAASVTAVSGLDLGALVQKAHNPWSILPPLDRNR